MKQNTGQTPVREHNRTHNSQTDTRPAGGTRSVWVSNETRNASQPPLSSRTAEVTTSKLQKVDGKKKQRKREVRGEVIQATYVRGKAGEGKLDKADKALNYGSTA